MRTKAKVRVLPEETWDSAIATLLSVAVVYLACLS